MSPRFSLLVALGVLLPSSAMADWQAPKPFGPPAAAIPNRKMSADDKARQVTNAFAVCIAKRFTPKLERALAMAPLSESYRALAKVADSDCVDGRFSLAMPGTLLRGAAFRALYIRDFKLPLLQGTPIVVDYVREAGSDAHAYQRATLKSFGSCVAKLDPAAARSLVLAEVASIEEDQSIARLRSSLGDCLRDGTLKLNRGALQSVLAEVLYRERISGLPTMVGAR